MVPKKLARKTMNYGLPMQSIERNTFLCVAVPLRSRQPFFHSFCSGGKFPYPGPGSVATSPFTVTTGP